MRCTIKRLKARSVSVAAVFAKSLREIRGKRVLTRDSTLFSVNLSPRNSRFSQRAPIHRAQSAVIARHRREICHCSEHQSLDCSKIRVFRRILAVATIFHSQLLLSSHPRRAAVRSRIIRYTLAIHARSTLNEKFDFVHTRTFTTNIRHYLYIAINYHGNK